MIEFKAVPLASLLNLRNQYLDSLRYPQELHCEWLVAKGTCFCIEQDEERVGYFIQSEEGELIEFYLSDELLSRKEEIFGRALKEFQIKSAFCKSFDDSAGRGYATMIISHLKESCLKAGYTPIAGCAADNVASRRTLERCGFMTKHCAIAFDFYRK